MFSELQFTSIQLVVLLIVLALLITGIIIGVRAFLKANTKADMEQKFEENVHEVSTRTKYSNVDIFRFRGTILNLSLVLVLALIVGAFNWTTFDDEVYIPDYDLTVEEDIQIAPPQTKVVPPPPPPPPPSVIQEVPDELIEEDESPEFIDQSVDEQSVIEAEPVIEEVKAAPPPPPPPPPPKVEEIFKVVEDMPRFPGCEDSGGSKAERKSCAEKKMLEFVYKNIKYPSIARENGVSGMVVVQFVVDSKGEIKNAKVLRDIGAMCGDEALRIVNMMPKWVPGKQRGRPVSVQFNLPIKFELRDT